MENSTRSPHDAAADSSALTSGRSDVGALADRRWCDSDWLRCITPGGAGGRGTVAGGSPGARCPLRSANVLLAAAAARLVND